MDFVTYLSPEGRAQMSPFGDLPLISPLYVSPEGLPQIGPFGDLPQTSGTSQGGLVLDTGRGTNLSLFLDGGRSICFGRQSTPYATLKKKEIYPYHSLRTTKSTNDKRFVRRSLCWTGPTTLYTFFSKLGSKDHLMAGKFGPRVKFVSGSLRSWDPICLRVRRPSYSIWLRGFPMCLRQQEQLRKTFQRKTIRSLVPGARARPARLTSASTLHHKRRLQQLLQRLHIRTLHLRDPETESYPIRTRLLCSSRTSPTPTQMTLRGAFFWSVGGCWWPL